MAVKILDEAKTMEYDVNLALIKRAIRDSDTFADVLGVILAHMPIGALHRVYQIDIELSDGSIHCLIDNNELTSAFLGSTSFHREVEHFRGRWRKWFAARNIDLFVKLSSQTVEGALLQSAHKKLEEEHKRLQEEHAALANAHRDVSRSANALLEEVDGLKRAAVVYNKRIGELEKEFARLTEGRDRALEEVRLSGRTIGELKQSLASCHKVIVERDAEIGKLRSIVPGISYRTSV